jgi:hypothetical protein
MVDLLALLDTAIDEFERETSSRCSRSYGKVQSRPGTSNQLQRMALPAVPVSTAQKQRSYDSITDPATASSKNRQENRAGEYHSNRPGTTGTPGTDESLCAFPFTNKAEENGDEREHGMREADAIGRPAPLLSAQTAAVGTDIKDDPDGTIRPLLLRDGRRMWRFHANDTSSDSPDGKLVAEARRHQVVLVVDGAVLHVVEPWLSTLPEDILRALYEQAGAVIAALRDDHHLRYPETGSEGSQ